MNYSLSQIAQDTGGELSGKNITVTLVSTDSRRTTDPTQTLFVAIHGNNRDGHAFIAVCQRCAGLHGLQVIRHETFS